MEGVDRIGVVDMETGQIYKAQEVNRTGGGDQSAARNRRTIEAFLRYCDAVTPKDKKAYASFITLGLDAGIEQYDRFQKAIDGFLRYIKGPYVYSIEVGTKGKKLHIHMLTRDYQEIDTLRSNWAAYAKMNTAIVSIQAVPSQMYQMADEKVSHERLPYYLVKYMTKAREQMAGIRCFRSSKGLRKQIAKYFEKEGFILFLSKDLYLVREAMKNGNYKPVDNSQGDGSR